MHTKIMARAFSGNTKVVLKGYKGSEAEAFANKWGLPFEKLISEDLNTVFDEKIERENASLEQLKNAEDENPETLQNMLDSSAEKLKSLKQNCVSTKDEYDTVSEELYLADAINAYIYFVNYDKARL